MQLRVPLAAEIAAARGVAALSRLAGAGGGTTVPGKLLSKLDPGAIDRLAARLPAGAAVISATNGKTTTAAMAAEILGPRFRLAHNRSGANLVSGVASTLLASGGAELALLEVDEAALPEVIRRVHPRTVCLGNLFRDQLDRYGELEIVADGWRDAVATLDDGLDARPERGRSAARRARLGAPADNGVRARRSSGGAARAPARRRLEVLRALRNALRLCGRIRRAPGRLPVPGLRSRAPAARRRRDGRSSSPGSSSASFDLVAPEGSRRVELALPGLYNVYNAVAAAALARALGASLDEIAAGLGRFSAAFGRFERIPVGDKGVLLLLIKNPAGANEAVRTLVDGGAPRVAVVALNDGIADGRDVSWIWDVDFEPLLAGLERVVASGDRAAELALRFAYGGLAESAIEVEPSLERALDRGLALTPAGGELVVLPTYTAMLGLQRIVSARGFTKPYWEQTA